MGKAISKQKRKQMKVLMLGLDKAGKTTLLYQMKMAQTIAPLSTVGFNLETFKHNKTRFTVWDVGGKDVIRPLWKHYYENAQVLIYVIDGADENRFIEAKEELHKVVKDMDLKGVPLVVVMNKLDAGRKAFPERMKDFLSLSSLDRSCELFETCALNGKGIPAVLDWIASHSC